MADTKDVHAKQQYYVDCIERLRGGAINRLEWQKLYELLDHLSEGVPLVLQRVTPADKFARLGALNLWRRTSGGCLLSETLKTEIQRIHKNPENITAFLLDAFVSDYFGRIGSEEAYKLTSAYTAVILSSHPQIAGLIYDSVDHEAGACLAIKPEVFDTLLRPTDVQIVEVKSYLGYGIYDFVELDRATHFEQEKIIWD